MQLGDSFNFEFVCTAETAAFHYLVYSCDLHVGCGAGGFNEVYVRLQLLLLSPFLFLLFVHRVLLLSVSVLSLDISTAAQSGDLILSCFCCCCFLCCCCCCC